MFLNKVSDLGYITEMGFNFIFLVLKKIFVDFWLVIGLLKCLYLYTLIRVLKRISPYWLSVVTLFITGGLGFLLIDNPLRFMTALILVNVAMEFCLKKGKKMAFILATLSFFIHNASIFFVILILLMLNAEKIAKWNRQYTIVLYLIVVAISSNVLIIEAMRSAMVLLAGIIGNTKSYYGYAVENNAGFFTLGNLASIILFFVVVYSRDVIVKQYENGLFIYSMTILYCLLSKLFMIIPTGFRLTIPFAVFYMSYMVYLIRSKSLYKWVFIIYVSLSFPLSLWKTYKYIPYTNSIPYIVSGHKDYDVRFIYNINAYEERTGKRYSGDFEQQM